MYVGRNNLLNRYLITWEHNVVRWCELILVMVCLLLSILMFYKKIFITTKIVHAAVDAAFLFIIATDVLSWCVKTPMTIKTWMVISSAGFLMYCFNAGLLLFYKRRTAVGLIIFNIVANIITAIVFLLDCIWICWEYIHADYKTVQNVDPRIFPGGTGPRIKSMTSLQGRNLVDRAVSACFLLEINEFECPVARKRKGNVVYPIVRPLRPMSYGGTFPVDKDLAPLSSGGSYKGISTQVSGITMSPCQTARSRRSARPVSTAEGSSLMLTRNNTNASSSCEVSRPKSHTDSDDSPQLSRAKSDHDCRCTILSETPCDCPGTSRARPGSNAQVSCRKGGKRYRSEPARSDTQKDQTDTDSGGTVRCSCTIHSN